MSKPFRGSVFRARALESAQGRNGARAPVKRSMKMRMKTRIIGPGTRECHRARINRRAGSAPATTVRAGFKCLLVAALVLATMPGTATARQDGKPVIGFLAFESGGCQNAAFHRGMRELGYVDGQNMIFECRHAHGRYEELDAAVRELLDTKPDVLVVFGHAPAKAAQRATQSIPIVASTSGEPVSMGFAKSLARPGANITGVSYYAPELNLKRLEFLKQIVPDLSRLAVLLHSGLPSDLADEYLRDCEEAGRILGFSIHVVKFGTLEEIDTAFARIDALGAQGVFVAPTREVRAETRRMAELGIQYRLPVVHSRKVFPATGGLLSYGPDYPQLYFRTAWYVDRILKGANPAEMPIEQPARIELHINLATARAIGVEVPEAVLLRADKVIE